MSRRLMPDVIPQLSPGSLSAILGWWAGELGVHMPELAALSDGITLSASVNLPGVLLFRRGGDLRIGAMPHKIERISEHLIGHRHAQIFTGSFWKKYFPDWYGAEVGPALLFYLDSIPATRDCTAPEGYTIRALTGVDATRFKAFADALTPEEREHSSLEFGPRPLWGAFAKRELAAIAGYDAWPGRIAHIGVAVHPDHRRKGLGKITAATAARAALARSRIVQYRTLASNAGSVGIAHALGLPRFAETLYIRPPAGKWV